MHHLSCVWNVAECLCLECGGVTLRDRVWRTWHRARHPEQVDICQISPRVILLEASGYSSRHNGSGCWQTNWFLSVRVLRWLKSLRWCSQDFYNGDIYGIRLTECFPWEGTEWINIKFINTTTTTIDYWMRWIEQCFISPQLPTRISSSPLKIRRHLHLNVK